MRYTVNKVPFLKGETEVAPDKSISQNGDFICFVSRLKPGK